jgi:hypothetical protein
MFSLSRVALTLRGAAHCTLEDFSGPKSLIDRREARAYGVVKVRP